MAAENAIPTIDLTPLRSGDAAAKREVARQIDAACRDTGFFLVAGHGVPTDLITKTRQRAIDFFALPDEEKLKVQRPPCENQPRLQLGRRPLDRLFDGRRRRRPTSRRRSRFGPDRADLASKVDQVSAQMYAPNIWPQRPDDFRETMVAYYDAMMGLGVARAARDGGGARR